MPRPGPRPYECVRRAWHSDRHQPIRGSLIQELFRVANELHSPSTRKNKEWQEKLPFVVLKAEEIMYSKANSEAEYMDLKTLLDRANDAIDTIIRRDDSNESGDLLEPCIEAALNLGCVPRRASRSQRHSSPRCYLTPSSQQPGGVDPPTTSLGAPDGNIRAYQHQGPYPRMPLPVSSPGRPQACNYQFIPRYPSLGSPVPANCGSMRAGSAAPMLASERRDSLPISYNGFSLPYMQSTRADQDKGMTFPPEACPWSGLGHVYPLYYPLSCQNAQLPVQDLGSSNCNAVASSNSSVPHMRETEAGCLYNFLPVNNVEEAQNEPSNIGNMSENRPEFDFDLSLRLGCPSEPYSGGGCSWVREVDDVGSSSSYRGNKYRDVGDSPISL